MHDVALDPKTVIAVLIHTFRELGEATTTIGGRVAFDVHGPNGGRWVVDLDVPGGDWAAEPGHDCASVLFAAEEDFPALVLEPERVPLLLLHGGMCLEGDASKWTKLGELLSRRGSAISVRCQ